MANWTKDPDGAAEDLVAGALDELALEPPVLWAGSARPRIEPVSGPAAAAVTWHRRFLHDQPGTPAPPRGPFATALLRLPKSRAEQIMSAHLCLGALTPHGRLIVYGGNDEGIRSFQKNIGELGLAATLITRGHGRILELRRQHVAAPLKSRIADWRQALAASAVGSARTWISYPGLFAGGVLDPGTALLLDHLPQLSANATVLDYGAGPGAISADIQRRHRHADITLLDNDSVALLAASENVPEATLVAGDRLAAAASRRFDLIVSNPPLHAGFKEDTSALHRLIADARSYLNPGGALLLVVQARLSLDRALSASFTTAETLASNGRYKVWRGSGATPK